MLNSLIFLNTPHDEKHVNHDFPSCYHTSYPHNIAPRDSRDVGVAEVVLEPSANVLQ
jgi:hypothetical protein